MAGGGAGLAKRLGTLLSGLLECGAFCGIIFGWASLVFVLKELGYFQDLCEATTTTTLAPNWTLLPNCSRQDEQFSLVFTIGSFMNNFMIFPMGFIFDRFGTAVARLIAISLYTGGTLLVAFSTPELSVLLFPAMSMLSVGGILLILTNMQVGNLFGKYRSIIITLYNGAFDSSSAIFLIIKVLYEHGLSLRAMFLFMAACSTWHLLRTLFLMPCTRIPYPLPPAYNYGWQRWEGPGRRWVGLGAWHGGVARCGGGQGLRACPGVSLGVSPALSPGAGGGDPPGMSFRACVCSRVFAWHVAWLSVMQLRHYLFIGTLNPLLSHLAHGDARLVSTYTNAFAFTQLCGVLCAPWNGLILDRHKRGKNPRPEGALGMLADLQASVLSLVVTVTQCVLFSVCAAVPVLPVQFATFVLQVLSRSFLYGGNAAFLAIAGVLRPEAEEAALEVPEEDTRCPLESEAQTFSIHDPLSATTYRYAVVTRCQTFRKAQRTCSRCYHGRLASIHSYRVNVLLKRRARLCTNRTEVWIGAVTRTVGAAPTQPPQTEMWELQGPRAVGWDPRPGGTC
ncbi:PREDICTED: solute carrier family 43 member 3 [Nipponia nippon]|uniref:solute carrier family 43 member 3 n=1 Tax=Nipponia nippon TaxID=128390 RepID=UPI00051104C9|nr:PREDICTED: solute carrier family 43 member 3 [Nipponia nippon]